MSLKPVVSQRVSKASCGMRTGWDEGHAPAGVKASLTVLYMWLWWSGESRFLPSQQLWTVRNLFWTRGGEVGEVEGGKGGQG